MLWMLIILISLNVYPQNVKLRCFKDTIGFATKSWQIDSIIYRIMSNKFNYYKIREKDSKENIKYRFSICPHDDYIYAGYLYNELFSELNIKTVIIIGVAHKAAKYKIENKIVFDSYKYWQGPYKNIEISDIREEIIKNLPQDCYLIHDSLQMEEHSVEAFIPFLQYYNKDVKIVSMLIPYMSFEMINILSRQLARSISKVIKEKKLIWGKDFTILVSNDAAHYGDEEWGGKNYAPFGCDTVGYSKALEREFDIINTCLHIDTLNAEKFYKHTVDSSDWHQYKWTWCGRYSVPFGMCLSYYLSKESEEKSLSPVFAFYSTSIENKPLNVMDLLIGATAPATLHHWVGYFVAAYK